MGLGATLSILVLTSLIMNALAVDLDHIGHAPSYPPVGAPAPHRGGHHKGPGGHHHKAPAVAPVHPPVKTPVKAPVHAPVKAPVKAPVHAPVKAPAHPPVKAPAHPPVKAPAYPPVKPPVHPVAKLVAVRGMVYCKACKYRGVDTLMGATPLQGAVVLLTCNNTKYPLKVKGTTDKNGFFFIMPPKTVTTFGVHKCKVTLLSSGKATCSHPTNLHYGIKGASLIPTPKPSVLPKPPLPFDVFTVGPFAYEPSKKTPCKY